MSPSSVSSGGEFDGSKDSEHPLGMHPSSPSSLANRLAAAHGMNRKRNHLVDDDLMDGDNSSDIMPVVPSRRRSCSRDGGVDDIAVPDDDDDIHESGMLCLVIHSNKNKLCKCDFGAYFRSFITINYYLFR